MLDNNAGAFGLSKFGWVVGGVGAGLLVILKQAN